jgi:hypothetical protein
MEELGPIRLVVARARRRVRLQSALETAATAAPVSAAGALCAVVGVRLGWWSQSIGEAGVLAMAGAVIVAAGATAVWPREDESIARRLDRASGLADRLSTALAFSRSRRDRDVDPVAAGLVRLAIADGVRAATAANPSAAVPIRCPRDARLAVLSMLLALLVAGLSAQRRVSGADPVRRPVETAWHRGGHIALPVPAIAREDLAYVRRLVARFRARPEGGDDSAALLDDVEAQLDAAERGGLDRAGLIASVGEALGKGNRGQMDDILSAIRHSRPEPPVPPPPPPDEHPARCADPAAEVPGSSDHGAGRAHEPVMSGTASRPDAAVRDEQVTATDNRATTRRETVESAAQHGFASAGYRRVYAEYAAIVEDVMRAEAVPSSHRYFVERYFDRIQPW